MKISYTTQNENFSIGNLNCISVRRPQDFSVSFGDGRKQHSFLYTASGCMLYTFFHSDIDTIRAKAGELVFIPAGTKHSSTYLMENNTVIILQFDILYGTSPSLFHSPFLTGNMDHDTFIPALFSEFQNKIGIHTLYFQYKIYELLWHIYQTNNDIPTKFCKLLPGLHELQLYYQETFKIQYYADLCGMSETGFRRLFKEYTSLSPIEYRNKIRLSEARKLLKSGEFSVEEASEAVGFSNFSFFCRNYKKQFGHSPGKDV